MYDAFLNNQHFFSNVEQETLMMFTHSLSCLLFVRLFGDDDHDDVEATFGSLKKVKDEEKPVD